MNKEYKDLVMKNLNNLHLIPGTEIWIIRKGCYECPEKDDHCQINCKQKNKRYLEKSIIRKVKIIIDDSKRFYHEFIDTDDNCFYKADIDVTVFTDRMEALKAL